MEFVNITDYLSKHNKKKLFVWESFKFCFCDCDRDSFSTINIETYVDKIAVNKRRLKQRDYNDKACYYVNDYYFILKGYPEKIYALYTNILLDEWFHDKWHREIDTVVAKLIRLENDKISDYIIPDKYKNFFIKDENGKKVKLPICDEYYDEKTLKFPDNINESTNIMDIWNNNDADNIAKTVSEELGFYYKVNIKSGK